MSLDPHERLEALRREVLAETPVAPMPVPVPPTPATPTPATPGPQTPVAPMPVPQTPEPPTAPEPPHTEPASPDTGAGWDLQDLLADTSLSTWLGIGLLAVGGYMVLSWLVPGIDLIGSLILLGTGVVLLAQHFQRGAGAWALYAGAVLIGVGAGRVIGGLLPGSPHGLTAMGIGIAFLSIAYLRHTQAGGYGWQGMVGGASLGLGVIQFVLGLLPGSPGVIDLVVPALLLIGGGLLISRTRGRSAKP